MTDEASDQKKQKDVDMGPTKKSTEQMLPIDERKESRHLYQPEFDKDIAKDESQEVPIFDFKIYMNTR